MTAGLSPNNVPDRAALTDVRRVLTSDGSLGFTIPYPCFEVPRATCTETEDGAVHRVVGDYLTEGFWRSVNPEGARRAGNQHRTLSTYLTALVGHGFRIEAVHEPAPDVSSPPCSFGVPDYRPSWSFTPARRDHRPRMLPWQEPPCCQKFVNITEPSKKMPPNPVNNRCHDS
ncbi:hypothetical protein [Streptomyces sp. NBC_01707]|uniref:hypothetical protein n=1 Tax=Streptomyces sp. NBC_01707 TaxID=2975914 RepID=UPI00352C0365